MVFPRVVRGETGQLMIKDPNAVAAEEEEGEFGDTNLLNYNFNGNEAQEQSAVLYQNRQEMVRPQNTKGKSRIAKG